MDEKGNCVDQLGFISFEQHLKYMRKNECMLKSWDLINCWTRLFLCKNEKLEFTSKRQVSQILKGKTNVCYLDLGCSFY